MKEIEYRVRPVTRYVVTRWHSEDRCCGSETCGEFDNETQAFRAMEAFANHEKKPEATTMVSDGKSIRWSE